jgi:Tfp pilus assembly protein PilN
MMIEVNLLPLELRRVEHTPLPRFLVVILGTAAVMATGAVGMVVNWRTLPDFRTRESTLVSDISRSELQAGAYNRLLEQIAETQDRKKAIAEVWRTRIMWSEKLAQIAEMTPTFVGLTELKLEEGRATTRVGQEEGGTLTIQSLCAGADHSRVANVRRIFQGQYRVAESSDPWLGKRFFGSFQDLLPTGTQMIEVKDCVETEALKFSLVMPLKAASVRLAEALQAAREEINRKQAEDKTHPGSTGEKTPKGAPAAHTEAPEKPQAKTAPAVETTPSAPTGTSSAAVTSSPAPEKPAPEATRAEKTDVVKEEKTGD